MIHLKKFNESSDQEIVLTMNDVRGLKHNLGYKSNTDDSFLKNYSWTEDQLLVATPAYSKPQEWDGKQVQIYDLYTKGERYHSELGYVILIDGKVEYLLGIYEPHGCSLNAKRGLITAHGHEQIIKIWLDDGEFEETHTR
jgi:hypothetical protein